MILLTGANGFIGRHVTRELLAGKQPLRTLLSRPRAEFDEQFPGAQIHCGDLLDRAVLQDALAGVRTVIHLASKSIDHDGTGFERVNIEGTRQLAEAAVQAGVERVIYVSSVGIYGHGVHRAATEETPIRPDTPFSRSKAAAEEILRSHHQAGDFQTVILRHRFVYGPGDQAVLPRLMKAARRIPIWLSGGRARMSLIWAPDLARILRQVSELEEKALTKQGPVFHVTDGQPISYREVITTICRVFGYRPPRISVPFSLLYFPVRLRERLLGIDPEVSQASVTSIRLKLVAQDNFFARQKLERLLPDLRCVGFEDGLRQSAQFYSQFTS